MSDRCQTPTRQAQRVRRRPEPEPVTTVTAKIDIGFGNQLFIRGEGDGLSWDKGQPLVCIDGSTWVWSSRGTKDRIRFKLLVNDQVWCRGENIELAAGGRLEVVPAF